MRAALAALLLLVVLPAPALAAERPSSTARDIVLRPGQTGTVVTGRFQLAGVSWRGAGEAWFRTRLGTSGRWSAWRPGAPEDEDLPDAGSPERRASAWRVGNPYWTGTADRVQVRMRGMSGMRRIERMRGTALVRVRFVRSPAPAVPARRLSLAGSPPLVSRVAWGANESIRRGPPRYAGGVRFVIVHHTAGTNDYTRAQSAAIVRGIQTYHVTGNGWDDIGYNFLVDKYGQVFEGRFGGAERPVIGAHAEGFNSGSVGIALLGNYGSARPTAAAQAALVRLVAWRLDVAHVDPLSTFSWVSGGNARFPKGVPVFLRGVVGHRDTGFTECPGAQLYAQLGALARGAAGSGTPKIFEPAVAGAVGGPVRFTARLSAALPWTVTVSDGAGAVIAGGTGVGAAVDWTWDATGAPPGAYSWAIATAGARPATGALRGGAAAVLTLSQARATPAAFSPNGDGRDDVTTISYVLGAPAAVTARLLDAGGQELATLFAEQARQAGRNQFTFAAENVPDGSYRIVLAARAGSREVQGVVPVLVSRVLSRFTAAPAVFSPNGDRVADAVAFRFTLAGPAQVQLRILRRSRPVATPFSGPLGPGAQGLSWDGSTPGGRLPDGAYEAELTVTDAVGAVSQRLPLTADTRAPRLGLAALRPLRLRLDEPAHVTLRVNGRRLALRRPRAGVFLVPRIRVARTLVAVARDAAGNRSTLRHPR